jgi:hypothetical protein
LPSSRSESPQRVAARAVRRCLRSRAAFILSGLRAACRRPQVPPFTIATASASRARDPRFAPCDALPPRATWCEWACGELARAAMTHYTARAAALGPGAPRRSRRAALATQAAAVTRTRRASLASLGARSRHMPPLAPRNGLRGAMRSPFQTADATRSRRARIRGAQHVQRQFSERAAWVSSA